ncbi:HEAT repeat domain-containing protein [Pseudoalteromonas luteoviolacea]|uniref:HEAT repeat domain-containing protein n=1 Tax=Pseudoalteromonas luteoviolacea TaxID=43657 RepID=UPI001B3962E8|nr:HEAT repeat domain-containing protein [Pseudoalteromonas luteoviolacea]MBQ4814491.1 HEAT repeat domain-containing protein [Pseudoalteromonas luteoviolacea]
MNRVIPLLLCTLTLPFGSVSASQDCARWGDFTTLANTKMTTLNMPSQNRLSVSGQLVFRPLMQSDKFYWLGLQLSSAKLTLDNTDIQARYYSVPFAVKIAAQSGDILAYHFAAKLKAEDEQKLIAIYQQFHIEHLKKYDLRNPKILEESDNLGRYKIQYQKLADNSIQKHKLSYTMTTQGTQLFAFKKPEIKQDSFIFTTSACWVEKLNGFNNTRVESDKGDIRIDVAQSIKFVTKAQPIAADISLMSLPMDPLKWPLLSADNVYPKPLPVPLSSAEVFTNVLLNKDLHALSSAELLQLLYDNQIYLASLHALIKQQAFADKQLSRLLLMIGKSDSVYAHQLLGTLYLDTELDKNQRFRSLMALKYAEQPLNPALVEQLYAHIDNEALSKTDVKLARTALMVMGIIAKNQSGSVFAEQLTESLADRLVTTRDKHKQATLLNALGNSADSAHQERISKFLNNGDANLRATAALALSKMPNDVSLGYVEKSLKIETDNKAKQALLSAMGNNQLSESQVDDVLIFAHKQQGNEVRVAAINALAKQRAHHQGVIEKLKPLLRQERDQQVLKALMQAIHGNR